MRQINEKSHSVLKVIELFAGVGGFRLGLEAVGKREGTSSPYEVVWSCQYEPGCKKQHAAQIYGARWGNDELVSRNIFDVLDDADAMAKLKKTSPDMLVGGFPCQDYSVAKPKNQSAGIEGEKGVLWWAIHRMLQSFREDGKPIKYLLLENVDRLINSPSKMPGRDFAIILASLQSLGYAIEWRTVNAADYGFPQRRKRLFMMAYHTNCPVFQQQLRYTKGASQAMAWLTQDGTMAQPLPAQCKAGATLSSFASSSNVIATQQEYTVDEKGKSRFKSAGLCMDGTVWTCPTEAVRLADVQRYVGRPTLMTLGDIVNATDSVSEQYFIGEDSLARWEYLKGAKRANRTGPDGNSYVYAEGAVAFPDALDKPSRTIITSEGGSSASRTKHVVRHHDGRLRRLTPEELEALNGFPRGFTAHSGVSEAKRAFLMGNALSTGIVESLGEALVIQHSKVAGFPMTSSAA